MLDESQNTQLLSDRDTVGFLFTVVKEVHCRLLFFENGRKLGFPVNYQRINIVSRYVMKRNHVG